MKLFKLTILGLLLTFGTQVSKAQEGDFFLLHFQPNVNNVDFQNYDIAQDENGLVCFANRKGVLKFDGQSWELIPTPSSVVSLTYDASHKRLYVGCRNGFGYISANQNGLETYKSLSGKQEFFGDISHIKVVGNWAYFLSENQLFEYSAADKEITRTFSSTSEQHFFNVFFHAREAYLFTEEQELFKITGKGLEKQNLEGLKKNSTLMFSKSLDVRRSILGTAEGEMYVWKGDKLIPIDLQEKEYLKDHNLINGEVLNDSVMILSTLSGGIVSVNWRTGKTIGIIDYDSGLPDNEIYSLFKDENKNIWITHEYGITLLEFHIPMRVYSNYLGLNGNITSVIEHNNKLYVGTSTGLFYLDEATSLVEVQKLMNERTEQKTTTNRLKRVNNNPITQPNLSRSESIEKVEEEEEDKKKKSGWLKKLFKKKNKRKNRKGKNNEEEKDESKEEEKEVDATKNAESIVDNSSKIEEKKIVTIPKVARKNQKKPVRVAIKESSLGYHIYKRVEGIEGKCLQLIPFGNKLLVSSNSGVYEVDGDKSKPIFQEPVRYLHFSEKHRNIFMSTYDNRVVLMNFKKNRWNKLPYFQEFRDEISAFSQDDKDNLWMTGTNYIYKVQLDDKGRPSQAFPFEIFNPFNDVIQAINLDEKPYFLLSSGAFYYDTNLDGIMFDSAMTKELGENLRVLHSQPSKVWIMKGRDWMMFSENETMKTDSHKSLNYLRLAGDLSSIFVDESNNKVWAINKNNELFRIGLGSYSKSNKGYNVFLKHIKSANEKYFKLGNFELEKGSDELHFYFTTPAYFESDGVTYQYKLEGHDKGWSNWTSKSDVSYLSLPTGTYRLQVRGKSASGKLSEITPISFEVVPPYWEQPWFYGAEVLFFATLLFLSYRLNSSKQADKTTKIISQILTVFTLILIVEFIQVTIESKVVMKSTPVTNFLVQAGIALCVFPLERLLAYFIRQEHKRKTKKEIEEVKRA